MKAKVSISVVLSALAIAGFFVNEGAWSAESHRQEAGQLARDSAFGTITLGSPSTGLQPVAFTVLGNRLYYIEEGSTGPKVGMIDQRGNGRSGSPSLEARDMLPGWRPVSSSFHSRGSDLAFFDAGAQALVQVNPNSRKASKTATGLVVVGSFGRFRGGNILADSGNMMEFPISDFQKLEGIVSSQEAQQIVNRCRRGRVFLTDEGFVLKSIVRQSFNGRTAQESSRKERFIGRHNIRMDAAGKTAAVFSRHLPGVHLISEEGEHLASYRHPGNGRLITREHPLADMLGEGTRFLFQTDVLVGPRDVLISDLASSRLWQFDRATGASRSFHLPYDVQKMERDGRYLYVLGMEGRLERFVYPEWGSEH